MSMISTATAVIERLPVPDTIIRLGISHLVGRTHRGRPANGEVDDETFSAAMRSFPIAANTEEANAQHYELPPDFFGLILGPHRKYSSGFFMRDGESLAEAETNALGLTCSHADLRDGQAILELGCGWGSLSLWMAAGYPAARITAVSNSHAQRQFIQQTARDRGLSNLTVITAGMNEFMTGERFDRIVSVEMFEHMANWEPLLARARHWAYPDGRLFLHVFSHTGSMPLIQMTGSHGISLPVESCPVTVW